MDNSNNRRDGSAVARERCRPVAQHPQSSLIRLLVIARSPLHREGLQRALEAHARLRIVGAAATAHDALEVVRRQHPDVALVDLADPQGMPLAREITEHAPDTSVVGISMSSSEETVIAAAEAGVAVLLGPDAGVSELLSTLETVKRGELPGSPRTIAILQRRLRALARARSPEPALGRLTAREMDVMALISDGLSNREIATRLCIEVSTVKNHLHNIFEKLDVRDRAEAAARLRTSLDPR